MRSFEDIGNSGVCEVKVDSRKTESELSTCCNPWFIGNRDFDVGLW